jgi:hypothetical protein
VARSSRGGRRRASASAVVGARPLRASLAGAGGWAGCLGVCTEPWQARLSGGRTTDRCARAFAVRRDARSEATARVPRTSGAKGTGGPRLGVGARSYTDAEAAQRPARGAQCNQARNARCAGGAPERSHVAFQPVNASSVGFFSKKIE